MDLICPEINITAYGRVDLPNSLIAQIRSVLPDAFIRVWDNSPDELEISGASDIRWHRFNPSLSRVWNWAIAQASTPWVIVANDDIRLKPDWYKELVSDVREFSGSLWHGPSRFFLFHKSLIEQVGWFDERMTGFTFEDLDYIRRLNAVAVPHRYGTLSSLHRNAESLKQEIVRPCHPVINKEFMVEKYGEGHAVEDFNVYPRLATPDFYPLRPR